MKSDYDELLDALEYVPPESYDHYLRILNHLALRAASLDTELHNVLERRQDKKV